MRIAVVWKNDYPWDVRIEKFTDSLRDDGHTVFILSCNKNRLAKRETINGIQVHRLPCINPHVLNSLLSVPFYLNPFWARFISRTIREEEIDIIIVRDIPLAYLSIHAARKHSIPVLLDMAENYPAMYWEKARSDNPKRILDWIIKNPYLAEYFEKYAVNSVDHIFVVVEESARRLKQEYLINDDQISIVSNTPVLNLFQNNKKIEKGKKFLILYTGFIQKSRGLSTIVRALSLLKKKGLQLKLLLVGDGPFLEYLKKMAIEEQVNDMVDFTGWVDNKMIPQYIRSSDAGIIPHRKTLHTDTTIPNKIFDYMAGGKPVLVSNAAPMKRLVEKEKCGIVFEAGNSKSLADAIVRIMQNHNKTYGMGERGQVAVERIFNWGYDSRNLKKVVRSFEMRADDSRRAL